MRQADIDDQNHDLVRQQRQFRQAADVLTSAWMSFAEVQAIAVIGSVAKRLWKEVPRFAEFRRKQIEVWHECRDLDLALWIDSQVRLGELRRAGARALRKAYEDGLGVSITGHQVDTFLFEPGSDRYLGRLCSFNRCPKEKRDCLVPGCGAIPFNKRVAGFTPHDDLLAGVDGTTLYCRRTGLVRSAMSLPSVDAEAYPTNDTASGQVP